MPVVFADLSEAEVTRWMLLDNRGFGEDDRDAVAALLGELEAAGDDLALTGYDVGEIDSMLRELHRPAADPDEVPPTPAGPRSRLGDVYELGPHRLMCGDATVAGDVEALFAGSKAALTFTSPPYLDLRLYGGDLDLEPEHLATFIPVWAQQTRLLAVNLGLVIRDGDVVQHWDAYIEAARAAGVKLLAWNVWNREDATSMAAQKMTFPLWHEWVFVFGRERQTPNRVIATKNAGKATTRAQRQPDGSMSAPRTYGVADFKALGSVLTTPSHKGPSEGDHPAVFPVALPAAYIEAVTQHGDIVADPFAGSGTTMVAADQLGRRAFIMELDPGYCDVIRQRYADYTNQPEYAP